MINKVVIGLIIFLLLPTTQAETLFTAFQNSAPKFFEQEGAVTGICFDIIQALNTRLKSQNIVIESKYPGVVPLKRILTDLEHGQLHLFVGTSRNKLREKRYQFADQPIYELKEAFAKLKTDNFEYTDDASLYGKTIVSLNASHSAKRVSRIKGVKLYQTGSLNMAFKFQLMGRANLVFYHDLGLEYQIKHLQLKDQIVMVKKPFGKKFHYIGFNKQVSPQLIDKINQVLVEMSNDGTLLKIRNQYR